MKNSYIVTIFISLVTFAIAMTFHIKSLNKKIDAITLQYETKELKRSIDSISIENKKTIQEMNSKSQQSVEKSSKLIKSIKNEKTIIRDTTDTYMREYIQNYCPD